MVHKAANTHRTVFFSSHGKAPLSARLGERLSEIFRALFKKRKILIISDKNITSVPFSASAQIILTCAVLVITAWVSYTSGKNLHYREVLSEKEQTLHEKEKQITISNLTNKDLLSQVSDLHRNLERLNTYFDNVAEYDGRHGSAKKTGSDQKASLDIPEGQPGHLTQKDILSIKQTAGNTLNNINQGILSRVKELETVVAMTGLKLRSVTDLSSYKPDNTPLEPSDPAGNKGGAYIPKGHHIPEDSTFTISNSRLDANIDYLLRLEKVVDSLPLSYPIKNSRITSRFGGRADPFHGNQAIHTGLDMAGTANARIMATASGTVVRAGRSGAYGNLIEVRHDNGITTRYGHLSHILVRKGQKVSRGDIIGIQGSTGRSTGAHLHYEVRHHGIPYNPEKFLKAGHYVPEENKS